MTTLVSITALDDGSGLSRHLFSNGSYVDKEVPVEYVPTAEDIAADARLWRDSQLQATDGIPAITDHPERSAYLTYRTALRDWPSTSDFPDTKPTL
jgi:hypothetical protein